uniref:acid phosphatase n=1 Tax=Elaeophora elaphi TaxID=1147741 RepID=A0A0R3RM14_9BILA
LLQLWRHGDRSPLIIYPNDPHRESVWPNGIGELTEIYVRSTDINRTIASAMAVLAGMFSNGIAGKDYPRENDEPDWPRGWIPIPVHTVEFKHDHVCVSIPTVAAEAGRSSTVSLGRKFRAGGWHEEIIGGKEKYAKKHWRHLTYLSFNLTFNY